MPLRLKLGNPRMTRMGHVGRTDAVNAAGDGHELATHAAAPEGIVSFASSAQVSPGWNWRWQATHSVCRQ